MCNCVYICVCVFADGIQLAVCVLFEVMGFGPVRSVRFESPPLAVPSSADCHRNYSVTAFSEISSTPPTFSASVAATG